ncbi:flagellar hook-basal body complex protein [Roseospirillum parvum]|uniref:Flagellar hook protein FlgE n=1 Tax=Roseospirillum parvum TaxID=83401 RepID=A0A1G7W8H2_9PROT|nr:flagellar hook-basal body complex protein [Roseospirillum parvum]SDG68231.1 flagellar hook protein FlgE [Roseospirillum parvum]
MSLYGALFSGVSGLASQSSAMGAIADNVTNVNTIGYKGSKVNFKTLVTKQVSLTQYSPGGVQSAPRQGVDVQGLLQATTSSTDIGISGQGFFITNQASVPSSGDLYAYTRAGSFKVDSDGYLTNVGGFYLQGWPLQTWDGTTTASQVTVGNNTYMKAYKNDAGEITYVNDNVIDATNLRGLNLNTIGGTATATTTMSLGANLPSGVDINSTEKTNMLMYDSLGNAHNLNYTWFKSGTNAWGTIIEPPAGSASVQLRDQNNGIYYSAGRLDFRDTGIPANGSSLSFTHNATNIAINYSNAATDVHVPTVELDFTTTPPADGDTIDVTIGTETFTFEFDSNNSVTTGNISVAATGTLDTDIQNLADQIQNTMTSKFGEGTWTQVDTANDVVSIGGGLGVGDITSSAATPEAAVAAPASVNIQVTGRSLSEIVDDTAQAINAFLASQQGVPPTVPGGWGSRVAGTTGITFIPDANDIQFDTSALLDSNGNIASVQQDPNTTNVFTVTGVTATQNWLGSNPAMVEFNGDGSPDKFFGNDEATAADPRARIHIDWTNGALDMNDTTVTSGGSPAISLFAGNYNVPDGLTQQGDAYQINYITQNGAKFGNFAGLSIGEDGIVQALFDNGVTRPVFQIPIATFVNPNAMESLTGNAWIETDGSGQPTVRTAGDAGAGSIASAALEASTVDLGEEFTTMITTQRAYSAAAKIITTSDEMLDELVRIKR